MTLTKTYRSKERKVTEEEDKELEAQLQADWEDIGGVGNGMTPDQLEQVAVTTFGCPEAKEKPKGKTLMQVFSEAGMLDEDDE